VHPDGSAAEISPLWPLLAEIPDLKPKVENGVVMGLNGPDFSYAAEGGIATIEVITRPCTDLHGIQGIYEDAMGHLVEAADSVGLRVLGYGIQPKTPRSPQMLTDRQRYRVLLDRLGPPWLWFSVTASEQLHYAANRSEAVRLNNLANLLAPVVIALCGHSPIHSGIAGEACCSRELGMGLIDPGHNRHGMTGKPAENLDTYVREMAELPYFFERIDGIPHARQDTFVQWLDAHGDDDPEFVWAAFLLHDHYNWNSARLRSAHGTVELRAACQQPPDEHMAASALSMGICEAANALGDWLDGELGDRAWPMMTAWHPRVVELGLAAEDPFPGLLEGVLSRCANALEARGRAEEIFLEPLFGRLEDRENPAQRARDVFLAGGMPALIDYAAWS